MAKSNAYEVLPSDDEDFDRPPSKTSCYCCSKSQLSWPKSQRGYPIERKVIDVNGRLGSLYDTSTDNLIDQHSARISVPVTPPNRFICRVFPGRQSMARIDVLQNIGFENAIRHSLHHQMVTPFGISRLIEYDQAITQNTRFLYYSYRARKQKLPVKAKKTDRIVPPPRGPTAANYMITKILWGIEILCIIQIPNNQSVNEVDELLHYIQTRLQLNEIPISLNTYARDLLNQLNNITVYGSDTCIDDQYPPILNVLNRIPAWQKNVNYHQPLVYTLQPLRWLYSNLEFQQSCDPRDPAVPYIDRINPILKDIDNQIKDLDELFHNFPAKFSSTALDQRLRVLRQQYQHLLDAQEDLRNRIRKVIPDVRRHRIPQTTLDNIIAEQPYQCLHKNQIREFQNNVESLLAKARLIEQLKNDRFEYVNAFDVCSNGRNPMTNEAIDAILRRTFSQENGKIILWYSGDRLKREQINKWKQIYQQLTSERQQATQRTKVVYVDFTQCQQRLENFVIVRLPDSRRSDFITEIEPPRPRAKSVSPSRETRPRPLYPSPGPVKKPSKPLTMEIPPQRPRKPSPPPIIKLSPPTPPIELSRNAPPRTEINVLLLGETGVGKSTFINAFVNYLKFETLEKAERGEPVVLIPVSFLITIGDQFDEFIVKFGDSDPNEDYEHQGQSVTQHCKSYVFDLNDRFSLRLIDTPGIGDTRGVAQDVKNIDHILTYINTLPHLNAVCLLLKPNASRLNVFFRSCINQLLTYLTPIGYDNIIFCFTNSRATFYAPGDTGRLLREMLDQEHLTNDIPFKKDNTFCFDSESFRYLASRRCDIEFNEYQKVECKNSWNASVTESVRLLKFIQTRAPYNLQEYQTPKKVILDIIMCVRPFMETLRLIIYNWKITEAKLVFNQMVLYANPVAMEMCTHCAQTNMVEVGPFWITEYQPAPIKTTSNQHHRCPSNGNHFSIEAVVQHEFAGEGSGLKNERWQSSFQNFLFKCDRLYHFLRQQAPSIQNDPFVPIIERFLAEEQEISQIRNINSNMNRRVYEVLQSIKQIRQRNSQQLFESNERLSLRDAYQIIGELVHIPTVKVQINSIKRSRELIMKIHEHKISANLIQNKIFH